MIRARKNELILQTTSHLHLEIKNIGKRYHNQWLFRHINLALKTGDSLSVTGKNGSGKSTLMQVVYGLVQASEGEVLVDGKIDFEPHTVFGFTSPYMELPSEFSLLEIHNLYTGAGKMKMPLDEFLKYSEFTSVQSQKPVKQFSSGMLQRLKTALCFCSDSPVLLLDEPLTNMDSHGEKWYKNCVSLSHDRILIIAGNNPAEYEFCISNIQISNEAL